MASRSALLLQRELAWVQKENLWGIHVNIAQENLFHWQVLMEGPSHTPWEGGQFQLEVLFDDEFNESPPQVYFLTVPFHPNVDIYTGSPCIELLDHPNRWNPEIRIHGILLYLQYLLSHPCLENAVNAAAAEICVNSPRLYDQLVRDSVIASRRVQACLPPYNDEEQIPQRPPSPTIVTPLGVTFRPFPCSDSSSSAPSSASSSSPSVEIQRISFTDYYDEWKSVATSLPPCADMKYSRPEEMFFNARSVRAKTTIEQFRGILERQQNLWYGNISNIQATLQARNIRDRAMLHRRAEEQLTALAEKQMRDRLGRAPVNILPSGWKSSALSPTSTRSQSTRNPRQLLSMHGSAKSGKSVLGKTSEAASTQQERVDSLRRLYGLQDKKDVDEIRAEDAKPREVGLTSAADGNPLGAALPISREAPVGFLQKQGSLPSLSTKNLDSLAYVGTTLSIPSELADVEGRVSGKTGAEKAGTGTAQTYEDKCAVKSTGVLPQAAQDAWESEADELVQWSAGISDEVVLKDVIVVGDEGSADAVS